MTYGSSTDAAPALKDQRLAFTLRLLTVNRTRRQSNRPYGNKKKLNKNNTYRVSFPRSLHVFFLDSRPDGHADNLAAHRQRGRFVLLRGFRLFEPILAVDRHAVVAQGFNRAFDDFTCEQNKTSF